MPAFLVSSTTMSSRLAWLFAVFTLAITPILGTSLFSKNSPNEMTLGNYRKKYDLWMHLGWLIYEAIIMLMSSLAVNYQNPDGKVNQIAEQVRRLGAQLFPLIKRYAFDLRIPLTPPELFKVQLVMSICFFAMVTAVFLYSIYLWRMPAEERKQTFPDFGMIPKGRLQKKDFLFLSICSLATYEVYVGGLQFSQEVSQVDFWRYCLVIADCHVRDDLALIGAALFQSIALFGTLMITLAILYEMIGIVGRDKYISNSGQ